VLIDCFQMPPRNYDNFLHYAHDQYYYVNSFMGLNLVGNS
jgi:hypothetical protein